MKMREDDKVVSARWDTNKSDASVLPGLVPVGKGAGTR